MELPTDQLYPKLDLPTEKPYPQLAMETEKERRENFTHFMPLELVGDATLRKYQELLEHLSQIDGIGRAGYEDYGVLWLEVPLGKYWRMNYMTTLWTLVSLPISSSFGGTPWEMKKRHNCKKASPIRNWGA